MPDLRKTYDSPIYGPRKRAESIEAARDAIFAIRPDSHMEGSTGFAWSFMTRDNRGVIGTAWFSPRSGRCYYRVLAEGSVPW